MKFVLFYVLIGFIITWYGISASKLALKRRTTRRLRKCHPPASIRLKDPIFGLDIILQLFRALKTNERNTSLRQLFDDNGNTFQSRTWTGGNKIFTIEPNNLRSIFATDFASWGVQPMRLFGFEPFVGKGIMCTDGPDWESARSLIKPMFARTQIADLHLAAYAVHVREFMSLIPRDESTIDLQPLFARLALDASTEFLFGESLGTLTADTTTDSARGFLKAYTYGQMVVGRRLQLPQWNILTYGKEFREACKVAHNFVDGYIAKGQEFVARNNQEKTPQDEKRNSRRYVLAHELVKETDDLVAIRNQLLNIFLPAHEASAVALTNVFFNLARHPRVYAKLRQEIVRAWHTNKDLWTFEGLKSLQYLQHVINETFRLNPAIGTNTRMALCDTVLPGGGGSPLGFGSAPVYVKKGDIVSTSFYALHRRKDLFGEDASLFRPERWETLRPAPWSYMTFGGGPRHCPGQQLALTEVAYTIARMALTFEAVLNRDPVEEFEEVYKITTESKNGAKVGLVLAE